MDSDLTVKVVRDAAAGWWESDVEHGVLLGTRIVLEMGHNMMGPNLIYQEINYFLKELNTIINYWLICLQKNYLFIFGLRPLFTNIEEFLREKRKEKGIFEMITIVIHVMIITSF